MNDTPPMQCVIASICRGVRGDEGVVIERLYGTGFFINDKGHLITAMHVIEQALLDVEEKGGNIFFCPFHYEIKSFVCYQIHQHEFAPNGFDVAICTTGATSQTYFKLGKLDVGPWADVATQGYPASIVNKTATELQIQQRFHKGYVQREIPAGRMPNQNNPPLFELSFPITQGLSGSPLFIHDKAYDHLIGVCVGTITSQLVVYEDTQIENDKKVHIERTVKVEEFGIAHDIRELQDWRPDILSGEPLEKCIGNLGVTGSFQIEVNS